MGPLIYPFQIPEDIDQRALLREWLGIIVPSITIFTILTRYVLKAEQCPHHLNQKSGKLQITGGPLQLLCFPWLGSFWLFLEGEKSLFSLLQACVLLAILPARNPVSQRIWTPADLDPFSRIWTPPYKNVIIQRNRMSHTSDAWSQFFYEFCVADRAI